MNEYEIKYVRYDCIFYQNVKADNIIEAIGKFISLELGINILVIRLVEQNEK